MFQAVTSMIGSTRYGIWNTNCTALTAQILRAIPHICRTVTAVL